MKRILIAILAALAVLAFTACDNSGKTDSGYFVAFDMNGHGKRVETQIVREGECISEPEVTGASDYSLLGWFTDKACTEVFNFQTPITSDLVLYAKWELKPDDKRLLGEWVFTGDLMKDDNVVIDFDEDGNWEYFVDIPEYYDALIFDEDIVIETNLIIKMKVYSVVDNWERGEEVTDTLSEAEMERIEEYLLKSHFYYESYRYEVDMDEKRINTFDEDGNFVDYYDYEFPREGFLFIDLYYSGRYMRIEE